MSDPVTVLAVVAVVGVVAQAIGVRTKIPAIVLLLGSGLLLGPGLGLLQPDDVYGDLLFPAASAAVAFLLFEGGLSLRFRELSGERLVLARLLTVGVLVAWAVGGAAALVTGLPLGVAAIFGAIMTVTGPTVVIPILREARLRPRITKVLRWEGILIDPIGAVLAVVTFEVVVEGHGRAGDAVRAVAATVGAGAAVGVIVAGVVVFLLHRHYITDRLEVPAIVAGVLVAVALANSLYDCWRPESRHGRWCRKQQRPRSSSWCSCWSLALHRCGRRPSALDSPPTSAVTSPAWPPGGWSPHPSRPCSPFDWKNSECRVEKVWPRWRSWSSLGPSSSTAPRPGRLHGCSGWRLRSGPESCSSGASRGSWESVLLCLPPTYRSSC